MMLCCMIVEPVELGDLIETRKTDCFVKTRPVAHAPRGFGIIIIIDHDHDTILNP